MGKVNLTCMAWLFTVSLCFLTLSNHPRQGVRLPLSQPIFDLVLDFRHCALNCPGHQLFRGFEVIVHSTFALPSIAPIHSSIASVPCWLLHNLSVFSWSLLFTKPGVGSMICSQCFRQGVSALVADTSAVHLILHKVESKGEPAWMDSLCWMWFWVGSRSLNAVNQKVFAVLQTVAVGGVGGKRTKAVKNHTCSCMAWTDRKK